MNALTMMVAAVSGAVIGVDLLDHFDYGELDAHCSCPVCAGWREKEGLWLNCVAETGGHGIECRCQKCRNKMRARSAYLSALHRRNLICELSWHASMQRNGMPLMSWIWDQVVIKRTYRDSWWERDGAERPIIGWLREFSADMRVMTAAASGMV